MALMVVSIAASIARREICVPLVRLPGSSAWPLSEGIWKSTLIGAANSNALSRSGASQASAPGARVLARDARDAHATGSSLDASACARGSSTATHAQRLERLRA
eukprot:6203432-Pleurochrysis_carterae.AAC.1